MRKRIDCNGKEDVAIYKDIVDNYIITSKVYITESIIDVYYYKGIV